MARSLLKDVLSDHLFGFVAHDVLDSRAGVEQGAVRIAYADDLREVLHDQTKQCPASGEFCGESMFAGSSQGAGPYQLEAPTD